MIEKQVSADDIRLADTRTHVVLRRMTSEDIDQVAALDRISFPTPWPLRTYEYEVLNNESSRMLVLEPAHAPLVAIPQRQRGWLERMLHIGNGNGRTHYRPLMCGYSGMWHIAGEAHISTIAVHPEWRGRGLGELLVWTMMRQAFWEGATQMTLEVRASNTVAQRLYRKYGFEIMGLRKNYYRDNEEDAYTMAVLPLDEAYRAKLIHYGKLLAQQVHVSNEQRQLAT